MVYCMLNNYYLSLTHTVHISNFYNCKKKTMGGRTALLGEIELEHSRLHLASWTGKFQ